MWTAPSSGSECLLMSYIYFWKVISISIVLQGMEQNERYSLLILYMNIHKEWGLIDIQQRKCFSNML